MTATLKTPRRLLILGGSLHHRGGLEAFCERAAEAVNDHAFGWAAEWWTTDTAYLSPARLGAAGVAWRRVADADRRTINLVWLQWSTLSDLLFLWRARAAGLPVMVTPHLGANSRLQRMPVLRALCVRLLARADRLAPLFPGQEAEISLPTGVPRSTVRTFLPASALMLPPPSPRHGPLRLIHAGRLSHGKGSFRMVTLCAALRDRGITFDAQIIGRADAGTMAALNQAIADAGLGDALTLVSWMDAAALIAALSAADVLVHLSELDSFPLIVLEALAAGATPVVADMAGARSMVERHGGFVTPGSSVKAAVDWLAGQDLADLRRRAQTAAASVRADYDWQRCVDLLVTAADQILAPRAAV